MKKQKKKNAYFRLKSSVFSIFSSKSWSNIQMAGDERIELPTVVLETIIIPFN